MGTFLLILIFLPVIFIFYLPVRMAYVRGRSGFIWFCLSLLLTPVITIILLAILGDGRRIRRAYQRY